MKAICADFALGFVKWFLIEPVLQRFIENDMVTADQPGEIKGFRRRIKRNRAHFCILADGLRRDMDFIAQYNFLTAAPDRII